MDKNRVIFHYPFVVALPLFGWYCYDDALSMALNNAAVGAVPLLFYIGLVLGIGLIFGESSS
jgi:hypothetical protein